MGEYDIYGYADEVDFGASDVNEILQNVRTILTTIKGTVPLDRGFGISGEYIDNPTVIAQAKLVSQIITEVEKNEPRCKVISVKFDRKDSESILIPKVKVKIDEQYL